MESARVTYSDRDRSSMFVIFFVFVQSHPQTWRYSPQHLDEAPVEIQPCTWMVDNRIQLHKQSPVCFLQSRRAQEFLRKPAGAVHIFNLKT